jgi:3-oxoacyl-[acyl-carrier protein] reductase
MRAQCDERGVSLVVVSGDMIDGMIIVRPLERRNPSAVAPDQLVTNGLAVV